MSEDLGDLERLASTSEALLWTLAWYADTKAAIDEGQRALALLGEGFPAARCPLLFSQAAGHSALGEADAALRLLDEGKRLHQTLADAVVDRVAASVEATIGWHLMQLDRLDERALQAASLSRAAGDLWGEASVEYIVGASLLQRGRLGEAARSMEASLPRALRVGHHGAVWAHRHYSSMLAAARGDLSAAHVEALAAIEYGRTRHVRWAAYSQQFIGTIALYQGRGSEALQHIRTAIDNEPATFLHGSCHATLFWALAHERDPGALPFLRQNPPPLPIPGKPNRMGAWLSLPPVVEGLAWLGQREEVASLREPRPWSRPASWAGVSRSSASARGSPPRPRTSGRAPRRTTRLRCSRRPASRAVAPSPRPARGTRRCCSTATAKATMAAPARSSKRPSRCTRPSACPASNVGPASASHPSKSLAQQEPAPRDSLRHTLPRERPAPCRLRHRHTSGMHNIWRHARPSSWMTRPGRPLGSSPDATAAPCRRPPGERSSASATPRSECPVSDGGSGSRLCGGSSLSSRTTIPWSRSEG